ncbi:smc6 [Candida oxycetoniae]|uniref:Smc6 n=1 Tax=Candida oxycetoniae TaxID=497107 RepID=A0AAI9T1R5_9ASCO|nr:smc6 [Candida oxycetoniae]KAI3406450.2 smc6 [Candida oxycetoniae]
MAATLTGRKRNYEEFSSDSNNADSSMRDQLSRQISDLQHSSRQNQAFVTSGVLSNGSDEKGGAAGVGGAAAGVTASAGAVGGAAAGASAAAAAAAASAASAGAASTGDTEADSESLESAESTDSDDESDNEFDDDGENENADSNGNAMSPAEAGVIEKLTLKNFMCHDFFELELGPQINFIIGRNGSGKSAILTGILVGLGAKASDTNRGSSIRDLIKDSKNTSRISVVLKNEGVWAFKPEEYGRKIIIERKLQRNGSNTYAIKSEEGKTVSTKKAILEEILYQFNITIDNPLAFLSQDKAREFLTSATAETKFEYFMDGAFITDICNNLDFTKSNIGEIDNKIKQSKVYTAKCKADYKAIAKIYNSHKKHDYLRDKLDLLSGKIHWFNVNAIEEKIMRFSAKAAMLESQIDTKKAEIEAFDKEIEQKIPEQSRLEGECVKAESDFDFKSRQVEEMRDARSKVKAQINVLEKDIKKNLSAIEDLKRDIVKTEKNIAQEKTKIEEQQGGSKEQMKEQLANVVVEIKQVEQEIEAGRQRIKQIERNPDSQLEDLSKAKQEASVKIQELNMRLVDLDRDQNSHYAPWGASRMQSIKRDIDRGHWVEKPIGPIGSLVSVKREFGPWKLLLDAVLSKTLDSFIVANEKDRPVLQQILRKHQAYHNIMVRKTERFSLDNGKAVVGITVMDMLNVENEGALYALIDSNSIEKIIIARSSEEAERLCRQSNVHSVLLQFSRDSGKRVSFNGDIRLDPVYYSTKAPKFGTTNKNELLEEIKREINEEKQNINNIERELRSLKVQIDSERNKLIIEVNLLKQKLDKLKQLRSALEDKIEAEVDFTNITNFEMRVEENNLQIKRLEPLNEALAEEIEAKKERYNILNAEVRKAKQAAADSQESLGAARKALRTGFEYLKALESEKINREQEISKNQLEVENARGLVAKGTPKLMAEMEEAKKICTREEADIKESDTQESISDEYQDIMQQIAISEKQIGSNFEEIVEKLREVDEVVKTALANEKELEEIRRRLNEELVVRRNFLSTTVNHQIKTAKKSFESSMDLRGFKGSINLNFIKKTLDILVKTKQDVEERNADGRSVESLSGGEKSYTQIALLLAIWQTMNSKIRGLDEFDVYMDSVNRSISIKLLLKNLLKYPKSQNIFITPQDIAVVGDLDNECVKIHKMSDPRRT